MEFVISYNTIYNHADFVKDLKFIITRYIVDNNAFLKKYIRIL